MSESFESQEPKVDLSKQENPPTTPPYTQTPYYPVQEHPADMVKPDNYLVWSIITTIVCCMPLGLVALIRSVQVDSAWAQGDFVRAQQYSKQARTWSIISAVTYLAAILVFLLVWVTLAATVSTLPSSKYSCNGLDTASCIEKHSKNQFPASFNQSRSTSS